MKYFIGTTSQQKISYVKSEIEYYTNSPCDLVCVEVSSGIAGQPIGIEETKRGAINRANAAYHSVTKNHHVGIGIEAGLVRANINDLCLVVVVCMFDGYRTITTMSAPLLIPRDVAEKVLLNHEFGEEIRQYSKDHAHSNDSFTEIVLTELITREISTRSAIQQGLVQLTHQ